jgi:hypothetical protein
MHLEACDFVVVLELARKKAIEWHLVPTGGQHFNRLMERMIRIPQNTQETNAREF